MILMSPIEKEVLREAVILLNTATSNSMTPEIRQGWTKARDRVVERLREMATP